MKRFLFLSLVVILCHSCEKPGHEPDIIAPENSYSISTEMVLRINENSAVVTGYVNLTDESTDPIVGIMYATDSLVRGDDVMTVRLEMSEVEINGKFEAELTGLDSNEKYWYRAYLITSGGNTVFGEILSFSTSGLKVKINTDPISYVSGS